MSHTRTKVKLLPVDTASGRPGPGERVLVTSGSMHTQTVAYWYPDFDNNGQVRWFYNGYAQARIPDCFCPTHYAPMPALVHHLSQQWQAFVGPPDECLQDIMLEDGTVIMGVYPNGMLWIVRGSWANNPKGYRKGSVIQISQAKHVRLSQLQP